MKSILNENEKKKLLENFQVSGMTQAAFAVENGINPKTLARWIYQSLKLIFWDKTGFWLAQKRLERNTWPWSENTKEAREITQRQLEMLLSGIDFWRAHEEIKFPAVF